MPKPRLRYVLYLVGGVIFLLSVKRPLCVLRPGELIFPALVLFAVLLALEIFFLIWRSYQVRSYLHKGDPEKFLEETRKEIAASPGRRWKDFYRVNSTAGLFYLGRFDEALQILEGIEMRKLHKTYRMLYINNRLANLLGAERIAEAEALVREHEEVFRPGPHNQKFYFALQANLGALKYYQGKLQVAQYLLEESMKAHNYPLALGVAHYYLGRIAETEGRSEEAQDHYAQAREFGKNTFVAQRLA